MALGPAVLARGGGLDLAAEDVADELHAVADPQHGHAQFEEPRGAKGGAGLVDARRPAGEDQGQGVQLLDTLEGHVVPNDAGEGLALPDPAGDELHVLRPEIEHEDGAFVEAFHSKSLGGERIYSKSPRA